MRWKVVSFYTVGTGYEQEIKRLETSLRKWGIDYEIFPCKPIGSWRGNLNYKSEVVLKSLEAYRDKDIVFLDADAVVQQYPALFDKLSEARTADVAAHFFQYSFSPDELLSGTLWFQNNAASRALVKRWDELGRAWPNIRHQKCLKVAIQQFAKEGKPVTVFKLPIEYTCIFDAPARLGKAAVIEHFQASRRFRRAVGFGPSLIHNALKKGLPSRPAARRPLHAKGIGPK